MKKWILVFVILIFVMSFIFAEQSDTYDWEDGIGTALGTYGNAIISNSTIQANGGTQSLELLEEPIGGTPQAFIWWVTGLTDGDVIDASFYVYDVTPGGNPSGRIWGHYTSDSGDINSYSGSAGGNSEYSSGSGWEEISHQWTFASSGDDDGIVIEARIYSSTGNNILYFDDTEITISSDTAVIHKIYDAGTNALPVIENVTRTPTGDVTSSDAVSVSADITDADGTIAEAILWWGTVSGTLNNPIFMLTADRATYTTENDIPAQPVGTTVYYKIEATDNESETTTTSEQSYTVFDAQSTIIPYSEDFATDLGQCYTNSVTGDTKVWVWNSSGYAYMSGFNSGVTEQDWLILPAINFDNYSDELMSFDTWFQYGTDDETNYLKLYYSSDYSGIGDPTTSTWTELIFSRPSAATTWTTSGSIDLSGISGISVYIGFKYNYEAGNYRNWGVDNISIQEVSTPTVTVTSPNGGEEWEQDSTHDITWDTTIFTVNAQVGIAVEYPGVDDEILLTPEPILNTGTYSWDIPADFAINNTYKIKIGVYENEDEVYDLSDDFFSVIEPVVVPDPGDVIITEIMQNPGTVGDSNGEYFELYNTTDGVIDINGWIVCDAGSNTATIDNGGPLIIYSNSYLVLGNDIDPLTNGGYTCDYQYSGFNLANGDDEVIIKIGEVIIDAVYYDGGPLFPDPTGASMELDPNHMNSVDNDDGANWYTAYTTYGDGDFGTPGSANPGLVGSLDTPTNVVISHDGTNVTITWDAVTGANSYKVFACDTPDGEFLEDTGGVFSPPTTWTKAESNGKKFYNVKASTD